MTYKFWKNAAILSAIVGSVGIAGYVVAAPNSQPPVSAGYGQSQGQHPGWENSHPYKRGQMHTPAQREQILQAVEDGDYEQWKSLVVVNGQAPKQFENITADNFAKFAEMHKAMEDKDFEKAKALRRDLGFGMGGYKMGARHGLGQGKGGCNR